MEGNIYKSVTSSYETE